MTIPEGDSEARKSTIERVSLFHPHRIQDGQTEYELVFDGPILTGLPYKARCGRLVDTNEPIVLKTALTDAGIHLLDREARIGGQLWADFRIPAYPQRFSRFIGHNTERGTLLLLQTRRGVPLEELPDPGGLRLEGERLWSAVLGLLVGLAELSGIGLVHRAISPRTVLWDGTDVQITDFADAVVERAPVTWAAGGAPWSPPSAAWQPGTRLAADSRDDVYSVAALIFWLHTGEAIGDPAEMRARLSRHALLHPLLDGCFADRAVDRPTPTQLLERSSVTDPRPPGRRGSIPDEEMRAEREYEEIRRRQLQRLRDFDAQSRPSGRREGAGPAIPAPIRSSARTAPPLLRQPCLPSRRTSTVTVVVVSSALAMLAVLAAIVIMLTAVLR